MLTTEIEYNSLTSFEAYSREVNAVWTNFDVRESFTKIFIIAPEWNDFSVEIYKSTNDITNRPGLSIAQVISIPFFHTVSIISIGGYIVSHTILTIKRCL